MKAFDPATLASAAVEHAMACGADAAGIASWPEVMRTPSYQIQPFLSSYSGVGASGRKRQPGGPRPGSLLVVGLGHPASRLDLDWWQEHLPRRTLGNDLLAGITNNVAERLAAEHGVKAWDLPYHPGRGGVYLKDAAVLAGIGGVGRNNLLIAPGFGPRIRLRAMALEPALPSGGASGYDPCADCKAPCRAVCPQDAMSQAWLADLGGPSHLPARDGSYDRVRCNRQMEADIAARHTTVDPGTGRPSGQVRYCRRCELACLAVRL